MMLQNIEKKIHNEVLVYLPLQVKEALTNLSEEKLSQLEEIRLRCGQALILKIADKEYCLDQNYNLIQKTEKGLKVDREDIYRTIASISENSIYAFEEDIQRGYITVPGGHRVGLAGKVILENKNIKLIKEFSSLSFRIARQVKNCAKKLLPHVCPVGKTPINTLIISPPRCGKTTILRDLVRLLALDYPEGRGINVVLIDERSEIAATYQGKAQMDIGNRTDVLDACPKALGMIMAVRALSPQVIITDEIGREDDVNAISECINAGVSVISSIHALNLEEAMKRPSMEAMFKMGLFKLGVILSRRNGPGTIEEIIRWEK